ncbi:MAG TPA: type II secretion system F family protein [Elusimicrobiales bacterium]|nr:type II secretion system F family protein [Elusimicrobiales bacterium]
MDIEKVFLFILSSISAFAVFIFLENLLTPPKKQKDSLTALIKDKTQDISPFSRLKPDGSFIDRLDLFFAKTLKLEEKLKTTHMLLGSPKTPNPLHMLHFKLIAAVLLPVLLFIMFSSPMVILFIPAGFIIPDAIYSSKIRNRQDELLENFSTTVDLVSLIVEAGMDYITAFERVTNIELKKSLLEQEIDKMLSEIKFGYSRRNALIRFADRTGIQEIRSFVGLIIQSDELGTSLVDLLNNFSADMRFRRLNKAEQAAAKASTKMLIPLFIFIFPVVFILAFSPVVSDLMKGGLF